MKKNVLSVALLMMSGFTFAQVGIGTANPNPAALLDVEANAGSFKGVLIPRIPLVSATNSSNINGGKTPNSLLVFNTTESNELKPGYYFWFDKQWVRLISSTDDFLEDLAANEELAVNIQEQTLFLRDSKNHIVSVPLADVNLVTTLESNGQGKYTYTSEDNTQTVIDVTADVINNINVIINQEEVINEIVESIAQNAKALSGDGIIEVVGGERAVFTTTSLSIKPSSITTAKIAPGGNKQLLVTDENGAVKWVDVSDEVIQEAFEFNEKVTLLVDGGDGTFTYYNEKGIDADGNAIPGQGVKFDANTLRIDKTADNTYAFYDKSNATTPIAVIDVAGSVIENITEILNDTTVQNDIYHSVAAQGKAATAADGSITVTNGDQAVLNAMQLSVANAGITTAKIAPGGNKQLLITDENGAVKWVDASDEVIQEAFEFNEKVTLLVDGGDGTFTYYNEKGIDADGNAIPGQGVKFDANTLRIDKTADNTYAFYDKSNATTPIAVIDVAGSVIENITEILNDTTVQNDIYHSVAAQGKAATAADGSITVTNGDQAVLNAMQLSVANAGITTAKIAPGGNKQLLVTDENGAVKWVDVSDEVIQEAFEFNEKVTLLVDGGDGTFTYYNEKGIDADGNAIPGQGVKFDANTLQIRERTGVREKGIYDFYDGVTTADNPLMTISTRASSIVFENNSENIPGDNLQEILDTIIQKIEVAQGRPSDLRGNGILVNGEAQESNAVLKDITLSIADNAITEGKIDDEAISSYKLKTGAVSPIKIAPGDHKQVLITDENGAVKWVGASDEIIKELVEHHEALTLLIDEGNGTFTYYNEKGIDEDGAVIPGMGMTFDANTLRIEKTADNAYAFYDKSDATTPLAVIDVAGSVIENITEILNDTTVQNDIYHSVAAQGKAATAADGSITVTNGDQAVLNAMQLSVANAGITTAKIAPGGNKQLLVTDENGTVKWVDASDEVIQEAFEFNEKVTLLVDGGDGTFTYYNEKGIDTDGNAIPGQGVKFDANTLRIDKTADNTYAFYDKSNATTPIAVIDVAGSVIENITEILNDTTVQNDIYHSVAAQGKAVTSPNASIAIGGAGDTAVLNAMELTIANEGVTTETIKNQAVTTAKIKPGTTGQFLVTGADGTAQWISATDEPIKEILSLNQAVTELIDNQNGTFTYFNEDDYDANGDKKPGALGTTFNANTLRVEQKMDPVTNLGSGVYEFYDLSSDTPIATIDVTTNIVENITEILNQEEVQNQIFASVAAKGKKIQSTDASIAITNGNKAALQNVTINIQQDGVKEGHIQDGAVTVAKINATGVAQNAVLTADGLGNASFESIADAVKPAAQGDLKGEAGVITIAGGGENVLFGGTDKEVTVGINERGIAGKHIGIKAVKGENIADQTITATKLVADTTDAGKVATVNADGSVSYLPLTSAVITDKGDITTDGVIQVNDGVGKVLSDVTFSIGEQSIKADRLDATGAETGAVATVNADGTVSYKPLEANAIAEKGNITTDGIVAVDNGTGKVLADVNLSITNQSITATQLADGTITNQQIAANTITVDKISAGNEPPKRVMVIDDQGVVKWGELDDIVTDAAGNLTTDNIIELKEGDGVNSLFNDVKLGIKDGSMTNQQLADKTIEISKLSNAGSQPGMVMVTDANGGFHYVDRESIVQAGADLQLGDELEFLDGNGVSAVLAETKIGITDGGITEAKLADGSVTTAKISALGAAENAVLTADGQGNVTYRKINETAFEGTEADLKSDGSLTIPADNKAVLKDLTIGIATGGVDNTHLANKAVTTAKIDAQAAASGAVLTSDGAGNAVFKTLGDVAETQGHAVASSDQSLAMTAGNKAALQALDIKVAAGGIKNAHLADGAVTEDKISTTKGAGLVLTSTIEGGAQFQPLGEVIGDGGKAIVGAASIEVTGGDHAALADVTIDVKNGGVTEAKLAQNSVSADKIQAQAVSAAKMIGDGALKLLGTDRSGAVTWLDAESDILQIITSLNETTTIVRDNGDGTFTYFNEADIDQNGAVKPDATGVKFDANTLKIAQDTTGVFVFTDKASNTPLATIDVRAKSIVFEDNSSHQYTNIEEAINQINQKVEVLEQLEIEKATLSGNGILINGNTSVADAVFTPVTLTIANEGVTTAKIKGGNAKQLLVTNEQGKAEWVDATDSIIEEIITTQEKVTVLQNNNNGTFTYFNENDVNAAGEIIGDGVTFNANTLRIEEDESGVFTFYNQASTTPIGTIDVAGTVIENITEILNESTVQNDIYTTVAAQGKLVQGDAAIQVTGGEKAALTEMTLSLKNQGITGEKIKNQAITADKLYAGENKENHVPVAQADGSVIYQPMAAVVSGQALTLDSSLAATGDTSKAVLQPFSLKVKEDGIGTSHIQNQAVTVDKINATGVDQGAVLTADGSGNAAFATANQVVAPAMQGDLVGSESILIEGGENVLFGTEETSVVVKINDGGVKGQHIAAGTIRNGNIADQTIQAAKLTAGTGEDHRVAVANAAGVVVYQPLSSAILTEKGNILTDEIISVSDNGVDKVLADVTLGVKDNSIKAGKLHGGNAQAGSVATVGSNGVTVTFEPLKASQLTAKGTISTDGVVTVDNGVDKVLANLKLGIKDQGITATQLKDGAVTNAKIADQVITADKLSSEGITAQSVLLSGENGEVTWGELGEIVDLTAGNLTTDSIIQMSTDGEKTLLKDIHLSVANNSITKDKLSSASQARDFILVTDGQGGFDYVLKEAVQAGGEDLRLGNALVFTDDTDGLNAVLAPTKIDLADGGVQGVKLAAGAVTVDKMNAGSAAANTVLTATGTNGTVEFKALSNTAFEGEGKDLTADHSITVTANNKALLAETTIAVAEGGIETKHIKDQAITTGKISSVVGENNATSGTVLTADGAGNVKFQSFEAVATTQGKPITSDTSLTIATNNAALQNVNIKVAEGGIKTAHIAARNVTEDKIASTEKARGLVLTTDGQGGAAFESLESVVGSSGKALQSGTGISITGAGANQALLKDAKVSIADGGVGTGQLGANVVTTAKMSSKIGTTSATAGHVLTADGNGNVNFVAPAGVSSGELKGSTSIDVANGQGAVLHNATLSLKNNGVKTGHIENEAITSVKIMDDAITNEKISEGAVTERKIGGNAVTESKIAGGAVIEAKLANEAVATSKIKNEAVTTAKIQDAAVTKAKISAAGETVGHVLTVEANGKVAFKAPTGQDVTKGNLTGSSIIKVSEGTDAVLKNVALDVNEHSIEGRHIKYATIGSDELAGGAVGTEELQNDAVTEEKLANQAVTSDKIAGGAVGTDELAANSVGFDIIKDYSVTPIKIATEEYDEDYAEEGLVLTSKGDGSAEFRRPSGGGAGFFYAPSFVVEIEPGAEGTKDVYNIYYEQFSNAIGSRTGARLNIYDREELDFFIVYYDDEVFEEVDIDGDGDLTYKTKRNPNVTTKTYFNVVMQLK
ncbi:beta strand repeat-containing protein [Myroides odoratus]|uniref:Uncharacterized protein n=3 Tax=Myroides odoratus TaxID=256 RepID=A0A9Q6Z5A5_MYROD|nr:hypothetical protein [Myroides odoratus]QQU01181.1 hypothetical protein I6I88_05360 [Myroides odoratus]WQD56563.1 hypothetical protein U0010_13670 [Myroides odoratus]STZ31151.1 Uncharacterised protein [Myroides odoratus]